MKMSRVNIIFLFIYKQNSENFLAVMLHKVLVYKSLVRQKKAWHMKGNHFSLVCSYCELYLQVKRLILVIIQVFLIIKTTIFNNGQVMSSML